MAVASLVPNRKVNFSISLSLYLAISLSLPFPYRQSCKELHLCKYCIEFYKQKHLISDPTCMLLLALFLLEKMANEKRGGEEKERREEI